MTIKLPMIYFTGTVKRLLQIYIIYKLQNYKDPKCAEQAQTHRVKLESSQLWLQMTLQFHGNSTMAVAEQQTPKTVTAADPGPIQPSMMNWINTKIFLPNRKPCQPVL